MEGAHAPMVKAVVGLLRLLYAFSAEAQAYTPESPVVKSAKMPLYPDLARQARIEGDGAGEGDY